MQLDANVLINSNEDARFRLRKMSNATVCFVPFKTRLQYLLHLAFEVLKNQALTHMSHLAKLAVMRSRTGESHWKAVRVILSCKSHF